MPKHSLALDLVWQTAVSAACASGYEYVEPQHLFVALCELPKVADAEGLRRMGLTEPDIRAVSAEAHALEQVFTYAALDPAALGSQMKTRIGTGPVASAVRGGGKVQRSPQSLQAFAIAGESAGSNDATITTLHLLAALLSLPNGSVAPWLKSKGVNPGGLSWSALSSAPSLDLMVPEERRGSRSAPIISELCKDLVQMAREGQLPPAIGREDEMLQVVRTLSRATKNNPLLIGEPGVGKTAIVEGLAIRMAQGDVPEVMQGKHIVQLDLSALVAGTSYRGEFEERTRRLLSEVAASPGTILFIDEIHTIVRAGAVEHGAMDAANIFKPALAKGTLRCIGATTLDEYREYIEADAALERRFQPIIVQEPSTDETIEILRGSLNRFLSQHHVTIPDETVQAAVHLSVRYIKDRFLPDKAIDLLDEACARVAITHLAAAKHAARRPCGIVTPDDIADVVTRWTGVPVSDPDADERSRLLDMESFLKQRVIGQDEAISCVTRVVQTARAGLKDPNRPIGVLLFRGCTGVGKTELAKALAEFLFGSEKAMIRFDMSEYIEPHSVSKLIGAPPGYLRSDEEGHLTEAVHRQPFSVVLFDEIEKAHRQVLDVLLQLFEEGRLTDSKGRTVDGTNALFIMTSNVGAGPAQRLGFLRSTQAASSRGEPVDDGAFFSPEFINRIDSNIEFHPLTKEHVAQIAALMLDKLSDRLAEQQLTLAYTHDALTLLAEWGHNPEYGARPLRRVIKDRVEAPLSLQLLRGELKTGDRILLDSSGDELAFRQETTRSS